MISNGHLYFKCSFLKLLNHGWNLATLEYLWWERLWGLSIIIKRFSEQIVCNSTFRMDHPSKKIQWRSIEQKKERLHSPRGNRTTFWFWMHFHEQTDFDGGPVQAHHKWKEACKKGTLFCYSLLSSSPRFSSTQLCATRSHSELNQEFTFVPHDLLKQFACHSSNMGSQSFSLPHVSPISYHLALHLSVSFLGPNSLAFSAISTIIHDDEERSWNFSPQFA